MTVLQPKAISLESAQFDFETEGPPDPQVFCVSIDVEIEATRGPEIYGGEHFAFLACSTAWLADEMSRRRAAWGRRYLILNEWNAEAIRHAVDVLCASAAHADWDRVVAELSRYMEVDTVDFRPEP